MAGIDKDSRKVKKAQELYDSGLDKYLDIMEDLTDEIVEINDLLRGYAAGREEPEYQLSSAQYGALKDRFNMWLSNLKNPDKILEHINDELRKKHSQKGEVKGSDPKSKSTSIKKEPVVAVFSPKAQ